MANREAQQKCEIGMVGLDVMGRNLVLNMTEHGFSVAAYDKDQTMAEALRKQSAERNVLCAANVSDFVALLRNPRASKYKYHLDLEAVARIWRGGCINRAALPEDTGAAFNARCELTNLLLDPNVSRKLTEHQEDLRYIVGQAIETGVPAPVVLASLGYLDAYRSAWLPPNLIEAQPDYFGAHTYERNDAKGTFHTEWQSEN